MAAQTQPAPQAQSNVKTFLQASFPQAGLMKVGGGNGSTTATYTTGETLSFATTAGDLGLLESIRVRVYGAITPTLGAGAAVWSQLRSFFTSVRIYRGDTLVKEVHPSYFAFRAYFMRRLYSADHTAYSPFVNSFATSNLASPLPAIAGATAINFVWELVIPSRLLRSALVDCMPVGDSSNPVRVELVTPTALYGVDPRNVPVLVSGGATVAIAATVAVKYAYRTALALASGTQIQQPVVGKTTKITQATTPIASVGDEIQVPFQVLRPTINALLTIEDGDADAATPEYGLMSLANISRLRWVLSNNTAVFDLDTQEKISFFVASLREASGVDFPDGVVPLSFIQQNWLSGYFDEPNLENMGQFPDFSQWKNSYLGVTVATGTTINSAGEGLARLTLVQEYLESVSY